MLTAAVLAGVTLFGQQITLPSWKTPHRLDFGPERVRNYSVGKWRLETRTDKFTGELACRLKARGMSYANHAVTFHFQGFVDTANAVYRIDGGPARKFADARWELVKGGTMLNRGPSSSPMAGDVPVPANEVMGASAVSVRANKNWGVRHYDVRGLPRALDMAKEQGCTPESFMEPVYS
ncbi:MAG: hypothetical protein IT546_01585 [Caulobacteraceae bacterium]|nr:hypothetical protein [Caulobacteraceae bacterium]